MARNTMTGRKWTSRCGAGSGMPLLFLAAGALWLFAVRPLLTSWWTRLLLPEWSLHAADVVFLTATSVLAHVVSRETHLDVRRVPPEDQKASFAAAVAAPPIPAPFAWTRESHGFRGLLDLIPDVVCFKFPDGRLFLMNLAARTLLGVEETEYPGLTFETLLKRQGWTWTNVPEGRTEAEAWQTARPMRLTMRLGRADGREVVLDVTKTPVYREDGTPDFLIVLGRDITAMRLVEERLRQSDKLASAGELAAGLAHELRNPMTSLKGFLRLLERRVDEHPEYFRIMQAELDRMDHIINEFLQLSKPHRVAARETDIACVIDDVVALLQTQAILHDVNLHTRLTASTPPILGDPSQLKQVFINLVKNAIEAMPAGGDVWLELEPSGETVLVRVRDNGTGIPQETLQQLGQPFFTTKPYGTGLGLQVSRKIVTEHQGWLRIESEPGAGTCVEVGFPAVSLAVRAQALGESGPQPS
ncbi:ATP-binding protein [Alicyclobacillus macrosporangiidus]|uniref:ATP-binding protein n=1 Tax=Alicyclobacillus macrosporangiidus TaxID=392015 RepID=UPI0006923D7D|nr:ATP-binding protein [Alicyclobacillus macrosporangiidus]